MLNLLDFLCCDPLILPFMNDLMRRCWIVVEEAKSTSIQDIKTRHWGFIWELLQFYIPLWFTLMWSLFVLSLVVKKHHADRPKIKETIRDEYVYVIQKPFVHIPQQYLGTLCLGWWPTPLSQLYAMVPSPHNVF